MVYVTLLFIAEFLFSHDFRLSKAGSAGEWEHSTATQDLQLYHVAARMGLT